MHNWRKKKWWLPLADRYMYWDSKISFNSSYEVPKDQVIDWDIPLVEAHNQSFRDRYGRLFKQVLPEKLSKTFWLIHFTPRAYDAYHIMIGHIGSLLVHSMRGIVRARKHVVYMIIYSYCITTNIQLVMLFLLWYVQL